MRKFHSVRNLPVGKTVRRVFLGLSLALVLVFAAQPSVSNAAVSATAYSAGFGAAFGYAQTVGPVSYTQAGSIGNGYGASIAVVPGTSSAASLAASVGNAAAYAQAIGSPFGSAAFVQTASFFGGAAFGAASANP